MPTDDVTVHLALCEGYTAADAELDSDAVLRDHKHTIEARSERLVVERPRELPRFLATVAPSDSRLGRWAVMVSRPSLIR